MRAWVLCPVTLTLELKITALESHGLPPAADHQDIFCEVSFVSQRDTEAVALRASHNFKPVDLEWRGYQDYRGYPTLSAAMNSNI